MPIRPEFLVRNAQGNPMPSPELVDRIKRFDPRIGLFYTKAAWAVTETWREDDPRRERIQKGELQPEYAFDICGYLPITCSLDEAPAFLARELASPCWTPEQFKGLREAVRRWNEKVDAKAEDDVRSAMSNDMDHFNIVSPGISVPVAFDFSNQGTAGTATAAPPAKPKGKKE